MFGKHPSTTEDIRVQVYLLRSTNRVVVDRKEVNILADDKTRVILWKKDSEFAHNVAKTSQRIASTDGVLAFTIGTPNRFTVFVVGKKSLRIIIVHPSKDDNWHNIVNDYIITDRVDDVVEDILLNGEEFANHISHCIPVKD